MYIRKILCTSINFPAGLNFPFPPSISCLKKREKIETKKSERKRENDRVGQKLKSRKKLKRDRQIDRQREVGLADRVSEA